MLLKGLQPKTIDGYARAIRRIGTHFDHQVTSLSLAPATRRLLHRHEGPALLARREARPVRPERRAAR